MEYYEELNLVSMQMEGYNRIIFVVKPSKSEYESIYATFKDNSGADKFSTDAPGVPQLSTLKLQEYFPPGGILRKGKILLRYQVTYTDKDSGLDHVSNHELVATVIDKT